ncbi:beta strand repeat-containing protein [Pseudomonas gingeri]
MPAPSFSGSTPASQRGMAATLMILFVGMALSVTALGMMYGIRGAQQQQVAAHAISPAESRVWSGVEWVRLYLQAQLLQDSTLANVTPGNLPISASGLSAQILSKVASAGSTLVTASITATNNLATNTLQVVYVLTPASAATAPPSGNLPPALQFNGNFNYTGGNLSITNGTTLANIAVTGVLTISNGSKAYVSGCAKGGINLSGGGIADNATLNTEGTFSMSSSSPPVNLTIGAKSINISQSDGSYVSIKAGAFKANVLSAGSTIGTALVGGTKNTDNSITAASTGTALITLTDGTVYTLDLSKASQSAGVISTSTGAQLISGTGTLPASISLSYNAIYGGDVNFRNATVGTFWGNTLALSGYSATYNTLKANSDVSILTATVGQFQGGGNLSVTQYNTPSFNTASQIAGKVLNQNGTAYTGTALANLTQNIAGASPGLPGIPYCNITSAPVDVTPLQSQANYVFYFDGNTPMLKIQNVKTAAGTAVAGGPYNLATTDLRTLLGNTFLTCNYGNSSCGNSATPANGWTFTGIKALPPGVLWFQGNITLDGVQGLSRLTNTVLATGNVALTSNSAVPLYSPNFSGYSNLCSGSFYPTNLCNKSATPPALATWTDSANVTHSGLPIGNIAIEANGGLATSGWTLYGNVILGGLVSTSGATTNIKGSLSTGNNGASPTTISQGGIAIDVSAVTGDQTITNPTPPTGGGGSGAVQASTKVRWVRAY